MPAAGGFFALSAIEFVLSRTIPGLIGFRILTGIAIALSQTTSRVLLAVHASRRGLANPGLVFATFAVGQVLVQPLLRHVSDRFGRGAAIGPGLMLVAAGMWTMALTSGWWLLAGGFLSGIGQGMVQPAIYALGSDLVGAGERGRAMGTLGVFLEVGIAASAIGGMDRPDVWPSDDVCACGGIAAVAAAKQRVALHCILPGQSGQD